MMMGFHHLLLVLLVVLYLVTIGLVQVQGFSVTVHNKYSSIFHEHQQQSAKHQATKRTVLTQNYYTSCSSVLKSTTSDSYTETAKQQQQQNEQNSNSNTSNKDDPEWKFFDTARINVSGGEGGDGCVAFRREKGEARGGPNGGRGGRGGSVYLQGNSRINTLQPLRQRIHLRANDGKNGLGKNKDGSQGNDCIIPVPIGTVVRDMMTQKFAGEIRANGGMLLVAKGGRGGRGNSAFMTSRRTAPKIMERGEPGSTRWLSIELKLVADVGIIGKPNAGKSTLLSVVSAARPKIANYPFTTIVPNLGVCDLFEDGDSITKKGKSSTEDDDNDNEDEIVSGTGLVLCDIPGLIEGASQGIGMGYAFLRHVQRCRVLLHVIDGTSDDPVQDYVAIQNELKSYDGFLSQKVQVIVINKIDVPEVTDKLQGLMEQLRKASGHTRVVAISAATKENVKQLMYRLRKLVIAQPIVDVLPQIAEIDLSKAGLEYDSSQFTIVSDPYYPGQWRIEGRYIEHVAKMTHWEYPEAVERFGRQLIALGISDELIKRGATDGDLIMIDQFDFDFSPGMTNPYIPSSLLEDDMIRNARYNNAENNKAGKLSSSSSEYQQRLKDNIFYRHGETVQDKWMVEQEKMARDGYAANEEDDDEDDDEVEAMFYMSDDDFDEDGNFIHGEDDEDEVWMAT